MSALYAPEGWIPTNQIRWCTDADVGHNGTSTSSTHLEQYFEDGLGGGGWFLVPSILEG